MTKYIDVFNGDADGICALLQCRLDAPCDAELITGVKRDNALLRRVEASAGDVLLVLDINFENNRSDVERLLADGAAIRYFDHHYPGERISHPGLELHIEESPDVCTSLLVNQSLQGRRWTWAVTGAFGDNLPGVAGQLAERQGLMEPDIARLRQLGELLNYNSYGNTVADLHFAPDTLYRLLYQYAEPLAFVAAAAEFRALAEGYAADMAAAGTLAPTASHAYGAVYILPDQAWARRVIGAWANALSQADPERAHLILCPDGLGRYTASLRAARTNPHGAAVFCRQFEGGGGRESAGGIQGLGEAQLNDVLSRFLATFSA